MENFVVSKNNKVHKVYVLDVQRTDCPGGPVKQTIVVEGDARVDMVLLVMPGVSCDLKLDVRLAGEGAEANIYGAYVCGEDERVKISVDLHHDLPHCNSRQLFKGIAGGVSRVDFYGKIICNNMIPVPESELIKIDVDAEQDQAYKGLLQKQIK